MSFDIIGSVRSAMVQSLLDAIDGASTPGKVKFYDGTKPSTVGAATVANLQVTIILGQPSGIVVDGGLTFTPGAEGMRFDDKLITWARFTDGDDNTVLDATVLQAGDPTAGVHIYITNTGGLVGGFVRITAGSVAL